MLVPVIVSETASAGSPAIPEPPAPSHPRRKRSDVTIELGRGRRVRVDSDIDTEALGRILIFNTESDRCTYMDLSAGEALLSAQGQDVGSANESLEVAYNGDIKRIAFPTRNLLDVLGHFVSAKIDMMLTGSEGPCGIRGGDDTDYTVIIMPMKVSETTYYSEEDV